MKALILFLTVTMAAAGSLVAQSLQLRHHGDLDRVWSLPVTPRRLDRNRGVSRQRRAVSSIRWLPGLHPPEAPSKPSTSTSTTSRPEPAKRRSATPVSRPVFAWPLPFNHVPQTFLKHATRFNRSGRRPTPGYIHFRRIRQYLLRWIQRFAAGVVLTVRFSRKVRP